jgi:hypothetical protein
VRENLTKLETSVKVGKLLADGRAHISTDLKYRDTRQLRAAVNTSHNRSVCDSLSHYGDRFADANAINEHFVEIATDPSYDRQQINNFIKTTKKDEVFKFLEHDIVGARSQVCQTTSKRAEPLPYWIFKQCSFELGPIITHNYNLILSTSVSPVSWKHSLVTPIPKVTPPRDYCDLRPISVTPILSRIYDKLFQPLC